MRDYRRVGGYLAGDMDDCERRRTVVPTDIALATLSGEPLEPSVDMGRTGAELFTSS